MDAREVTKVIQQVEITDRCYRLHFDIQTALKNSFHSGFDFIDKLSTIGDVLFSGGYAVIWLKPKMNKAMLLRKLRLLKVDEVYCESISLSDMQKEQTLLSAWYMEHYGAEQKRRMEEANQEMLRDCVRRIELAKQALLQNEKKGAGHGRQENTPHGGEET